MSSRSTGHLGSPGHRSDSGTLTVSSCMVQGDRLLMTPGLTQVVEPTAPSVLVEADGTATWTNGFDEIRAAQCRAVRSGSLRFEPR